jgi:flagella synthesis protein FlgN
MTIPGNSPARSLVEETRLARALLDLLKSEQEKLIAADIDGLNAVTEEKTSLVVQLSQLATARHSLLGAAGFEAAEAGMQAWLDQAGMPQAAQTWKELLNLADAAKEANRINGMLITKHLARNQAAINTLKGTNSDQSVYGPNGQSGATSIGRGLAIG